MEITRKHGVSSVVNATVNLRRLALIALTILLAGAGMSLQVSANAALILDNNGGGISHSSFGNGKFNRNAITANSPIFDRGFQHVGNNNAGGSTVSQVATCKKKFPACGISLRAWAATHW